MKHKYDISINIFNESRKKPGYKIPKTNEEYIWYEYCGLTMKMLIEDIKCGKLDYYKRYVKAYSTEQFKIEYDKRLLDGTGNILVDKILDKYVNNISKPWVL